LPTVVRSGFKANVRRKVLGVSVFGSVLARQRAAPAQPDERRAGDFGARGLEYLNHGRAWSGEYGDHHGGAAGAVGRAAARADRDQHAARHAWCRPGRYEVVAAHELVHSLGHAGHNSHLMAQTFQKVMGDTPAGDRLQANTVILPPLRLSDDSVSLLRGIWG